MKRVAQVLTVIVLAAMAAVCAAQQNGYLDLGRGSDQPIEIKSHKAELTRLPTGAEVSYEGSVRVRQGDVSLTCDRLTITYEDGAAGSNREKLAKKLPKDLQTAANITSIVASGNVKIVQQERMATAGKALFDNAKRTITLTGGPPRLWQGPDQLFADTIIIYLDEERSELLSDDKKEIRTIINPGKRKKDKGN